MPRSFSNDDYQVSQFLNKVLLRDAAQNLTRDNLYSINIFTLTTAQNIVVPPMTTLAEAQFQPGGSAIFIAAGAAAHTITPGVGVTINGGGSALVFSATPYQTTIVLTRLDNDEWIAERSIAAQVAVDGVIPLLLLSGAQSENIASYSAQWGLGGNTIDPTVLSATIFGGYAAGTVNSGANAVGKDIPANVVPLGTSAVGNNTADVYVAGTADYSQVLGYDNIANGLLSIILGAHSLTYTSTTHSYILGANSVISGVSDNNVVLGNQNSIDNSDGSAILGGTKNRISGGGDFNYLMGNGCAISGSGGSNTLLGGAGNLISSSSTYNFVFGGFSNTISGAAASGAIMGGNNNTNSSAFNGAVVASNTCSVSANNSSVIAGKNVVSTARASMAFGDTFDADTAGALIWGSEGTGSKSIVGSQFRLTTDATQQFMFTVNGDGIKLPINCAYSGYVQFVGIKAGAPNTSVSYTLFISGEVTSGVVNQHNAVAVVVGSPTLLATGLPIVSDIGGRELYAKVTGAAATNIKWRAQFNVNAVVA